MNIKKPKLWSALVVTVIYLVCFGLIYSMRGDTLTIKKRLYGDFEAGEPVEAEDAGAVTLVDYAVEGSYLKATFHAERETNFYFLVIPDKVSGREVNFALRADAECRLTNLDNDNFSGCEKLVPLTAAWAAGVFLCFMIAFRKQLRYSIFSYNTPIYFGFGMMALTVLLRSVQMLVSVTADPEQMSVISLRTSLADAGVYFANLSLPAFLIMTIGLVTSNISLLKKEGTGFTNMLGILMGVALTGGDMAILILSGMINGNIVTARIKQAVLNGFGALFLYFACMWIGSVAAGIIAAKRKADDDLDYLIVLGCGIRPDGTVTPLLKGRCDQAVKHYFRQKELGKTPVIIPSGGQGPDEVCSESEAMKNYLLTQGVREEDILCEDRSETTFQNFHFSRRLMDKEHAKSAFFTTNYHVFRSGIWARRAGFPRTQIQGEGAPTKWYFWPNAFIREFAGLLSSHRLKQFLICLGLVLAQITVTLLFWM
ncbi:MAG: YdcF family protein [Solobacterium sp.]|nr:YdcF family protein [Solobacterium sp.]